MAVQDNMRFSVNFQEKLRALRNALLDGFRVWGHGIGCQRHTISHLAGPAHPYVFRLTTNDEDNPIQYFANANDAAWAMLKAVDGQAIFTIEERENG